MIAKPPNQTDEGARLTPGGGLSEDDVAVLQRGLRRSLARLDNFSGACIEISAKDRDTPGQRITVEVWLPRIPRVVATSDRSELASAAAQLDAKVIAQLGHILGRRQPSSNRQRRGSIRQVRPAGDQR